MRIIAVFGSDALAGYTIAVRIAMFSILPAWGMSNAAATLAGQNLGAKKPDRAEKSVWRCGWYTMTFLGIVGVVFLLNAEALVRLFTPDLAVVARGAEALRIFSYGYVVYAWGLVIVQAFNGAGDTYTPTWINLFCFWMLELPLAYLLAEPLGVGYRGPAIAVVIAESTMTIVSIVIFRRGRWKTREV
jgi:Na+-driven multidrug efflux pump